MRVLLTNNYNTPSALSNAFKEVPIMLAELDDCDGVTEIKRVINKYSICREWELKIKTSKRIIYESVDRVGNLQYLIIKEYNL